ncbi:MAG: hypothetical protein JOY54_03985 [Acidobacteriaceae bacterium]|nr:hypothetical protein [Acidobacteriaceae bacterium]
MRSISPSRAVAFEVLEAAANGAYASDALRDRSVSLNARDASLAAQIVFGSLRFQRQLDYLIELYSGRKAPTLDLLILVALRGAIFQLRYLDRIPPHAAVHDSVEYVKVRKRAAAGFANAVLRKVNRSPVRWPEEATELSIPEWLLARWKSHFGVDAARQIARAALEEPAAYIRVPPGAALPAGVEVQSTEVEGAFRLLSPLKGGMRLQDIGSQSIVPLLELSPGQTYLDLCSAPGNKTLQALETPLNLAIACDVSERRVREIPPACPRMVLDATETLPFAAKFDRIFIDAPCSGTGTLARNPEIKWRLEEPELGRFRERQIAIVERALEVLAPAGKLVYATCSLEKEENEDVIAAVRRNCPEIRMERDLWRLPGRDEGDGFYAAVLARALS